LLKFIYIRPRHPVRPSRSDWMPRSDVKCPVGPGRSDWYNWGERLYNATPITGFLPHYPSIANLAIWTEYFYAH